jgi:hypothetical protein
MLRKKAEASDSKRNIFVGTETADRLNTNEFSSRKKSECQLTYNNTEK